MAGLEITKAKCDTCLNETNHKILCSEQISGSIDIVDWVDTYQVLECQGCNNVMFRKRHWFSEDQDFRPDACPVYRDTYFPPLSFREKPEWYSSLEKKLTEVLDELYIALQNDIRFLAAVGARTALDIVLVEKLGDKGTFVEKLNALKSRGLVTEAEREMLDAVTEAGNAAAHRGYSPNPDDLVAVMDILEAVIEKLYFAEKKESELLRKAKRLMQNVPSRAPR